MVKTIRKFYTGPVKVVPVAEKATFTLIGVECEAHLAKCNVEMVISDKGELIHAQVNEYKGIRPTKFTESEDGLTLSSAHEGENIISFLEHYRKKVNERDLVPEAVKKENEEHNG